MADYDRAYARLDDLDGMTNEEIKQAVQDVAEEAKDVGYAFAADTADRNEPAVACKVLPGPWLRELLADYPACQEGQRVDDLDELFAWFGC